MSPRATSSAPARARRLLVADDDDAIRDALAAVLRDEGWEVTEARDGDDALRLALERPFDVAVLDHRMPGLSGGEVHRALVERGVGLPVILVTAASRVKDVAAAHGIARYLGKPFSVEALLRAVEAALPEE